MFRNSLRTTGLIALALLLVAACGKKDEQPGAAPADSGLLAYVPADTPYVAVQYPLPDDVMDTLEPRLDRILRAYGEVIRQLALAEAARLEEQDALSEEELTAMTAVADVLAGLLSTDGLAAAGIDRHSSAVLFANGVFPVLRVTVSDPALMEKKIDELEQAAGRQLARAEIDNLRYRYAAQDQAKLVVAVSEGDLVVSVLPVSHSDSLLRSALGLTRPSRSIAQAGTLQALIDANGYDHSTVALMDVRQLTSLFVDEQSGINREVLDLAGYDPANLDEVCKSELRELAAIAPRVHAGYDRLDANGVEARMVVELRDDLAAGLKTLAAPVQGLGTVSAGLASFGMSLDMLAAREFYSARLDAMEAKPFKCDLFQDLQASVATGREALKQPLPPIVYSIKGFLAVIDTLDGIDVSSGHMPETLDASFLLAVDNPIGLVAMGAMFSPELAALNLQQDGKPARLELPPGSPLVGEAWLAMTEKSLVVAIGNEADKRIGELLAAEYASPSPMAALDMDSAAYYGILAQSMAGNADLDDADPAVSDAIKEAMLSLQQLARRQTVEMHFTDKGLELESTMTFMEPEK